MPSTRSTQSSLSPNRNVTLSLLWGDRAVTRSKGSPTYGELMPTATVQLLFRDVWIERRVEDLNLRAAEAMFDDLAAILKRRNEQSAPHD